MARIISVCNFKGGVGKSTVSVNLACGLADRHKGHCILVDADRQGTAVAWASSGALPVMVTQNTLSEARPEERFPGSLWVAQLRVLAETCDYIVVDLPPGLQYALPAVAALSDLVVVPVNHSGVEFHSTSLFVELLRRSRLIRAGKPACLILPNRIDPRTAAGQDLSRFDVFGEPVIRPLHRREAFARGFDEGRWIGDVAPGSAGHHEIMILVEEVGQALADLPAEPHDPLADGVAAPGRRPRGVTAAARG